MMPSVTSLFDNISLDSHCFIDGPILVYGAGNTGKTVVQHLSLNGYDVLSFIDKTATENLLFEGYPVVSLKNAYKLYGPKTPILIAIHNRGVDMVGVIQTVKNAGFLICYTMFDYARVLNTDNTFRFFLTDPKKLKSEKSNAEKFYHLLSDDLSRFFYFDLVKFRLSGDYFVCPKPTVQDQYSPVDIPRWNNPLRLIDCGAYNGDSIRLFDSYQYEIESVLAFEPDLSNYRALIKTTDYPNGVYIPCGVSDTAKVIRFNSGSGEGSRAAIDGDVTIQMLSIDEAFPDFAPNLIKMDIEGGERDAILGAKETSRKYRPGMAISAYHLPSDLWRVGLLISEIDADYNFYMRSHAYSSFETVLYAIPK
jgi:FkbM family methyltransferase